MNILPLSHLKEGRCYILIRLKDLRHRSRSGLTLYKSKENESSFIEIIESKKKNTVVGCIYKHPDVSVGEFTNDFLEPFLEKTFFRKTRSYSNGGLQYKPS